MLFSFNHTQCSGYPCPSTLYSVLHYLTRIPVLPMVCHRVASGATVSSNQKSILISLVCHLKSRVLSVSDLAMKVFKVNSQHDVISGCETVEIVVSKPELAIQISKAVFVGFPSKIKVNRAVQTSLNNGSTSTVCCHVTQHLD